jgi:hypothetical protein
LEIRRASSTIDTSRARAAPERRVPDQPALLSLLRTRDGGGITACQPFNSCTTRRTRSRSPVAHREARRQRLDPASGHQSPSEQVHDPLGQPLLAQHDVQLAAGGDLFQNFQFVQAHERRVALQQLGRVGYRFCRAFLRSRAGYFLWNAPTRNSGSNAPGTLPSAAWTHVVAKGIVFRAEETREIRITTTS